MDVPEQRHHLPPLWNQVPLYSTSATASLNVKEIMLAILKLSSITCIEWKQTSVVSSPSFSLDRDRVLKLWLIIVAFTLTASRSFGESWRYLRIQVRTLAVVSCAANSTPTTLSAIWSSVSSATAPAVPSSRDRMRPPRRSSPPPPPPPPRARRSATISLRIARSRFLACMRNACQRPREAVGEAVVASLHDGVVRPQLLPVPAAEPAAEDGHDADVERESSWRGRCWRRGRRTRRRAWRRRRRRRPGRGRGGSPGRGRPGRGGGGGGGTRPGGRRAPTARSSAPCSAGTSA
ncbi:Os08g0473200 [Oryza sativa Japonica Group]|uniref:Os08g0473200 protein n=1 Tax=Oryza sativa subsp. japonica TaxID=39947 RepID=A0A0P0XGZ9_ORYSJ|nr:hypothetical protein EE612_044858 [Oryza sativa]BAT05856.1 Os08g0473200 [Oryza sativa Japonica Group]